MSSSHHIARPTISCLAWPIATASLLLLGPACDRSDTERPSPAAATPRAVSPNPPTPAPSEPGQVPDANTVSPSDASVPVQADRSAANTDLSGPAQTVQQVNQLRRAGRLDEMAKLVVPSARPAIIELVRAVDRLVLANLALQEQIKASGASASAAFLDRPGAGNIIDVFSHDVQVISESQQADQATVTIQVGGRLPLSAVNLIQTDQGWQIQPDPPIPGLAAEIRKLAKAQQRVIRMVQKQHLSIEQIHKELTFWERPILKRIRGLTTQNKQTPK